MTGVIFYDVPSEFSFKGIYGLDVPELGYKASMFIAVLTENNKCNFAFIIRSRSFTRKIPDVHMQQLYNTRVKPIFEETKKKVLNVLYKYKTNCFVRTWDNTLQVLHFHCEDENEYGFKYLQVEELYNPEEYDKPKWDCFTFFKDKEETSFHSLEDLHTQNGDDNVLDFIKQPQLQSFSALSASHTTIA